MAFLEEVLVHGPSLNASDAFIETGSPVMFKIHGETDTHEGLEALQTENDVIEFLKAHVPGIDIDAIIKGAREIDGSFTLSDGSFVRANVYRTSEGIAATLRYLPNSIPELKNL